MVQQPEQLPPLDQDYLRINYYEAGFAYLLPELLKLLHEQAFLHLQSIEQLFQQKDLQTLAEEAHALKGSAGSVGAAALAAAAYTLEKKTTMVDNIQLHALIVQLRQATEETGNAITLELARLSAEEDAALNLV